MHIKPYIILGLATLCAGGSVLVLVVNIDPYTAPSTIIGLFWGSLFLFILGVVATIISIGGGRLGVALAGGSLWAVVLLALAALWQQGRNNWQLSAVVLGATILISFIVWWHGRRTKPNA